jgi:CRP-like cAMP-binding protein
LAYQRSFRVNSLSLPLVQKTPVRSKEGAPVTAVAKISQETLAEMIGTTRSRVNFFMNKFRKLGFIRYNGELTVHSSLLNVVVHDEPE